MAAEERQVDDARLLQLLWRGSEEPSARSGLTVGRIVTAGVELADEAGLDALSMRKVSERLGVGAMSLYTYVPGRQELVHLMVDQVHGELPRVPGTEPGNGWRQRLHALADQYWELFEQHPWLLDVPVERPVVGPNAMGRYEAELEIVDGLGLDEFEMNATIELVQEHVASAARRWRDIRRDAQASGVSDDEWWNAILPALEKVLAGRDYPLSSRVGEAIGAPHLETSYLLGFGLDRILDGLDALLTARQSDP